jgi:methyl-galactoside transport system substrate-binding protein
MLFKFNAILNMKGGFEMKIFKTLFLFLIIIIVTITSLSYTKIHANSQVIPQKQIKTAVLLFSFDDPYISLVRKGLEEIQNKNTSSVNFTFYDGKRNQDIQNALLDSVLQSNYDLLLLNLVNLDQGTIESVIYKAKQKNIPIILFNTVPFEIGPIKSYNKALVISTDAIQSGILQGNLVINEWNSSKNEIDRNGDNILQYIMLKGPENITVTAARSLYSISTINQSGIKTQEILSKTCTCAEDSMKLLFLSYGKNIEAIISNNDAMAIGAIKAL